MQDQKQAASSVPENPVRPYANIWRDVVHDERLTTYGFSLACKLKDWYQFEATEDYVRLTFREMEGRFKMTRKALSVAILNLESQGYIEIVRESKKKHFYRLLPKLTEGTPPHMHDAIYYAESEKDWVLSDKATNRLYHRLEISRPSFKNLCRTYANVPRNVWLKILNDVLSFQKRLEFGQEQPRCRSKRIAIQKYLQTCLENAFQPPIRISAPPDPERKARMEAKEKAETELFRLRDLAEYLNKGYVVFAPEFPDEATLSRLIQENHVFCFDTGWKASEGHVFWIDRGKLRAAPQDWYDRHVAPYIRNERRTNANVPQNIQTLLEQRENVHDQTSEAKQ